MAQRHSAAWFSWRPRILSVLRPQEVISRSGSKCNFPNGPCCMVTLCFIYHKVLNLSAIQELGLWGPCGNRVGLTVLTEKGILVAPFLATFESSNALRRRRKRRKGRGGGGTCGHNASEESFCHCLRPPVLEAPGGQALWPQVHCSAPAVPAPGT